MKKRIISIVIIALTLVSVFALASCGKEEVRNCPVPGCTGTLAIDDGIATCTSSKIHIFNVCNNEDCSAIISGSKYCPSCGANQDACAYCEDGDIDGTYCPKCGRHVLHSGDMKFKFDVDALGESAMILCKGMLGIFIVTGVIITFILVLNTVVEKANQAKENKDK